MKKIIFIKDHNFLGTKEIEIEVFEGYYLINILAWGDWYIEKVKTIDELKTILLEYNIQKSIIVQIIEKITN